MKEKKKKIRQIQVVAQPTDATPSKQMHAFASETLSFFVSFYFIFLSYVQQRGMMKKNRPSREAEVAADLHTRSVCTWAEHETETLKQTQRRTKCTVCFGKHTLKLNQWLLGCLFYTHIFVRTHKHSTVCQNATNQPVMCSQRFRISVSFHIWYRREK